MVEQPEKSPQYEPASSKSKIKSPTQIPRRVQAKAPLYSSPTLNGSSTKKQASKPGNIGGGIPRSLSTTIRANAENLIGLSEDPSFDRFQKQYTANQEDSILLHSSRSDLRSQSPTCQQPGPAFIGSNDKDAKLELPLQMINTDRTHESLGQHTNEEPIISASYAVPDGLRSLIPRQQQSSDNIRSSDQRSSDPIGFQDEFQLRGSYNTSAMKHMYSIKPLSGAKPFHLTSSFSSTSGLPNSYNRFNQTSYVNTQAKQKPGAQSHRALSTTTDNLNKSYNAAQDEVQKLIEQLQSDFQRQLRRKENDWSTKEALLTQKIEFLEAEVRDLKQREAKQKAMYQQMIEAMSHSTPQTPQHKRQETSEIRRESTLTDSASQAHLLELEQMYQARLDQARQELLELQREARQKQHVKDTAIKELQIRIETLQIDHQRLIQELQLDKKSLENQIKRLQIDKTQLETQVENSDSLDHQLAQLRQQLEVTEKEKAHQTEKMRKQVRDHNDALVKLEKQLQNQTADRVRQIEKESREKEISLQERLERQLQDLTEENLRQVEHMQEMNEQLRANLEGQLHQALVEKQIECERVAQLERQILGQAKYVNTSQSLFGTQVFQGGQMSTHFNNFGQFLENDTSSIQCSESQIMAFDECNLREKRVRDSQTDEVASLRAQLDKLRFKLKEAHQQNEDLQEREKSLHKKHKQQIEHVLMSIFLSDRYIKEGVSVDDVQALAKDELVGGQTREVYQKMINDEVQARLTCETQLQEIKHQLQQVRSQAQEQIGERDIQIKSLQSELKILTAEVETLRRDAEKENHERLANQPTQAKTADEHVFTPQKASNTKKQGIPSNQSLQPVSKQNRPPSQSALCKAYKEPQAPQLLHKTTQNAQVSTLQLKLLKSCQLMVDAASRMECSQCLQLFTTTDFYEHITTEGGSFQCMNHVKMMTNLSHQMSTRQQNRSFQNVSSSQNVVNFKSQLNLIKPRESSAGNLSQFRKAHNSSSLFFHKQRSSLGASMAASSTSHVNSGVPLPLMFHRTSQASGPLFHHVSVANPNTTQAFDHTMEESSILLQAPTLNSTTYQQFTQQLNAMQGNEAHLQGVSQLRPQSALNSGGSQTTFQQATLKMNAKAQKLTRNSTVKGPLQLAKSAEHPKFPEEKRKSPVTYEGPRPYAKPVQSSQAVQPLQIKNKTQNPLQSFFSHSHHQTQVNWSQKSWNQLNASNQGKRLDNEQPVNMSSISQLPPHPNAVFPRRSKAEDKPSELSNHKRAQSFTNGRIGVDPLFRGKSTEASAQLAKPSPIKPDRPSRITRHTRGSSLKTANNPELAGVIANHISSINENQIISVSQDMYPKHRFNDPINSEFLDGMICAREAINLAENIDRGMPLQDEEESMRTGSSMEQSDSANVQDQIGNGFFKQNYRQGDEKGTSFKRQQDALLSGKLAASNYFREDSATEAQPQEQELDSASDWYGSVSNQQNQEMLIAEKQLQMKIEREKVQGNQVFTGLAIPRQRAEVVPRLNLQGQQPIPNAHKQSARLNKNEGKRANYATQLLPPEKGKTSRDPAKRIEKADFGQTQPVSFLNTKMLELDTLEQSGNTNAYKLDSYRAYGKPYCTSTKGGQRYDKSNLLVSQSINNLEQVLDTQIDSRASQPAIEAVEKPAVIFSKLNLEQVARVVQNNESSSRTQSQLNAPRAGRLPTSSDYQADSVVRSEISDSLAPDDYVITKDEPVTQREEDGSATARHFVAAGPDINPAPQYHVLLAQHEPQKSRKPLDNRPKATVGIRDLNILMNMVAKGDKTNKIPPIPSKRPGEKPKGRINEGSHAVEYFFNETEPAKTSKRNMNSVPRKSPLFDKDFELVEQEMQIVQVRRSRFKTQSNEDSALIDSCEEDQGLFRDECDIDSTDLQEEQRVVESDVLADSETLKDELEDLPKSSGFSLFMCGALKDKGTELRSFFKPLKAQESFDQGRKRLGAQKTFKPSLMANQERKFDAQRSYLGIKLN